VSGGDRAGTWRVERAAVLGAGVMGAAIAAHLANVGIATLLLDLPGPEGGDRDAPANGGLRRARKSKPAAFASSRAPRLAECDLVIEAIIEDAALKSRLYERVAPHLGRHAVLASNTSGLSVAALSDALPEDVRSRFLVMHFFNPPRYLELLELVRGPATSDDVVARITELSERVLGKGVVVAKDTPNFIANRIGCFGMFHVLAVMREGGYTIAEVDKLTGKAVGRPKSATFRTADIVGLDTLAHVSGNLFERLTDDPHRALFDPPEFMTRLIADGRLGQKSGAGFYRKTRGAGGASEIQMLDTGSLDTGTLEYVPQPKVSFPSLELAKTQSDIRKRLAALVRAQDRAGAFVWKTISATIRYAAACIPEIADDVVSVDRAMRWGFGWELGPFETWDAIGFRWACERMLDEGAELPPLARELFDSGADGFYRRGPDETSCATSGGVFTIVPARSEHIVLDDLRRAGAVVREGPDATLHDVGDGVACLEFTTKMNTIGPGVIDALERAVDDVEANWRGLVIGNDGAQFSAGANLLLILNEIDDDNFEEVEWMVERFQRINQRLRLSSRPVVAAPHGLTLGGGCEITLGADAACAALETYIGLVEVGAGVVPAGGGCMEFVRRIDEAAPDAPGTDLFPYVQRAFETIGMGKVATSGFEGVEMGFLRPTDRVSISRRRQLHDAKNLVLSMDRAGYTPPGPRTDLRVVGEPGLATLRVGMDGMLRAGWISEYDRFVGDKLAWVLCGGEVGPSSRVSEAYLHELEKEAFMSLCAETKTQERMEHLLKTGKPLRN
jgi:3-hydroxyacyl-CoA dehydrogenase